MNKPFNFKNKANWHNIQIIIFPLLFVACKFLMQKLVVYSLKMQTLQAFDLKPKFPRIHW